MAAFVAYRLAIGVIILTSALTITTGVSPTRGREMLARYAHSSHRCIPEWTFNPRNSRCYKYFNTFTSFEYARKACQDIDQNLKIDLAQPKNLEENAFLHKLILADKTWDMSNKRQGIYLGSKTINKENSWLDKEDIDVTNWYLQSAEHASFENDYDTMTLGCLEGWTIFVTSAYYNRAEDCSLSAAKKKLQVMDDCEGKETCLVYPDTTESGDPICPNTDGYDSLVVDYTCMKVSTTADIQTTSTRTRVGCWGDTMELRCDSDQEIHIQSAHIGRQDHRDVCHDDPHGQYDNGCWKDVIFKVIEFCNRRAMKCTFDVNPTTMGGDLCTGKNRFIEVEYTCKSYTKTCLTLTLDGVWDFDYCHVDDKWKYVCSMAAEPVSCEEGWILSPDKESCYRHFASDVGKEYAQKNCKNFNADLALPRSKTENDFMYHIIDDAQKDEYKFIWLATNDKDAIDKYVDERYGHSLLYSNFPDECEPGWKMNMDNRLCYGYFDTTSSYSDATEACEARQANLPIITTAGENDFVHQLMSKDGSIKEYWDGIWLGAQKIGGQEAWVWWDGTPLYGYTNWLPDHSDLSTLECLDMIKDGHWTKALCINPLIRRHVCVKEPGEPGYSDWRCVMMTKDNDVDDGVWKRYKCTNNAPHICMKAVKKNGPRLPAAWPCMPGWLYYEANRRCYKYVQATNDFNSARAACKAFDPQLDIDLAMPKNVLENNFILKLFTDLDGVWANENPLNGVYLGSNSVEFNDWLDGEGFTWTNWKQGKPDDTLDDFKCLIMTPTGKWDHRRCKDPDDIKFIKSVCSMPAEPVSCDEGWVMNEAINRCYRVYSMLVDKKGATQTCDFSDSQVALPRTKQEDDFVLYMMKNYNGGYGVWLGANDETDLGSYVDDKYGYELEYTNWDTDIPVTQAPSTTKRCVVKLPIRFGGGHWWRFECGTGSYHAICSKDANDHGLRFGNDKHDWVVYVSTRNRTYAGSVPDTMTVEIMIHGDDKWFEHIELKNGHAEFEPGQTEHFEIETEVINRVSEIELSAYSNDEWTVHEVYLHNLDTKRRFYFIPDTVVLKRNHSDIEPVSHFTWKQTSNDWMVFTQRGEKNADDALLEISLHGNKMSSSWKTLDHKEYNNFVEDSRDHFHIFTKDIGELKGISLRAKNKSAYYWRWNRWYVEKVWLMNVKTAKYHTFVFNEYLSPTILHQLPS